MLALIEQGITLMHHGNTAFIYHIEFIKYVKVEGATLENVCDYLFDVGDGKILSEKGKR